MAAAGRPVHVGGPGRKSREMQMRGGKPKNSSAAIKRILTYLSKDKALILIAFICVIVFSVASILGSYMLKPIMDRLAECAADIAASTGDLRSRALLR